MKTRHPLISLLLLSASICLTTFAQTGTIKQLPKPQRDGGKPLLQALNDRKSSREFSMQKLTEQMLSDLLWAACGVNRPDGRRTAPTAMNRQEIDVYVILADGAWVFDAKDHVLRHVAAEDFRLQAGTQDYVKDAPVNLVFVADTGKMGNASDLDKALYYGADTGFISQNVYLYCASQGLATVVRASVDRPALAKSLGLRAEQRIVLAQSVGYPK